jgi:leucyl aminopeptidase
MNVSVTRDLASEGLDGWIVPFYESEFEGPGARLDGVLEGVIREAFDSKEFEGKSNTTLWVRPMGRLPVRRLVAVGLGKKGRNGAARAFAVGVRALRDVGCQRVGVALPSDDAEFAGAVAEAIVMGVYDFDKYKSGEEPPKAVSAVYIEGPESLAEAVERGRIIGQAANFCRDIANEPPVVATPDHVAGVARGLAGDKIKVTVLDEQTLAKSGMNAILAVGMGSAHPPRIVALEYRGAGDDAPLYAVVGKGVTFDSGGLSLKPPASMEDMKFDKCGACAVIGIVKAVADLGLKVNVIGVAGLAENLPGPTAYRPGDIIKAGNGKTIEVLNTDAEGRVVLADALYFAGTHKPAAMLDLATLTGACVVALGDICAGLMGNDEDLIAELKAAGERTGERVWQLPLWPEYDEKVKSEVADVKNIGERAGGTGLAGAIAGASFLKTFVPEGCRWAHLDIAGVADGRKKPWRGAGATGFGVRLVVDWLRQKA